MSSSSASEVLAYTRTAWHLISRTPGPAILVVSLVGWLWLFSDMVGMRGDDLTTAAGHHGGHLRHHAIADWAAMVLAMSPLVLRSEIAWLRRTNLPRRRALAIVMFCLGYALPWLALGIVARALPAGEALTGTPLLFAIGGLLTWHGSPMRQRLLNACHRRPGLRAFGPAMITDTVRYGLRAGGLCAAVCGPAMLFVMTLPRGHGPAMAAAALWLTVERYFAPRRPGWRLPWSPKDRAPLWKSYGFVTASVTPTSWERNQTHPSIRRRR